MIILLFITSIFLFYLCLEIYFHSNRLKKIPIRIAVTGTRGKTTVVHMITKILQDEGKIVLAKTTGSEAKYIFPNGTEVPVKRRGITSIIEQKLFIKKAYEHNAEIIVAEIMSLQPENHFIESHKLLRPNNIIITNIRKDHCAIMGETKEEIARVVSLVITKNSDVFIPRSEIKDVFLEKIKVNKAKLYEVGQNTKSKNIDRNSEELSIGFSDNYNLASDLCMHLGVDGKKLNSGLTNVNYDVGKVKIWKLQIAEQKKTIYFVNAFAANDPESTMNILTHLNQTLSFPNKIIGLMNIRKDRGYRTLQWINEMNCGNNKIFHKLFLIGENTRAVKRKLKYADLLTGISPEDITKDLNKNVTNNDVIFGFANIAGIGKSLVEYWDNIGEPYGI